MKTCYVYWIKHKNHNDISTQGYIGITVNPDLRWKQHQKTALKRVAPHKLYNAMKTHCEDISMTILVCGNVEYCLDLEKKLRPDKNIGYNAAVGGNPTLQARLAYSYDEDVGKKISDGIKNAYKNDPTLRERCGKKNTGRKLTEEHKQKLSASSPRHSAWENSRADLSVWANADKIYDAFTSGASSRKELSLATGIPYATIKVLHLKLTSGWVPNEDPRWLTYFKGVIS